MRAYKWTYARVYLCVPITISQPNQLLLFHQISHSDSHTTAYQGWTRAPSLQQVNILKSTTEWFHTLHSIFDREGRRERTSCPKARDGHRYPCLALVFHDSCCYVSWAAAPEGTRIQRESVCLLWEALASLWETWVNSWEAWASLWEAWASLWEA